MTLFFQCGLPLLEECKSLAEKSLSEGDLFSAVKFYLLSDEPETALSIGLQHVKGTYMHMNMFVLFFQLSFFNIYFHEQSANVLVLCSPSPEQLSGSDWTVDSIQPFLDLLSYIRTDRLIMVKMTE